MKFLHFIHVLCACIWVGSVLFIAIVLTPALKKEFEGLDRKRIEITAKIGRAFLPISWLSILLLVITGIIRIWKYVVNPEKLFDFSTPYSRTLTEKMIVTFFLLILKIIHDFIVGPKLQYIARSAFSIEEINLYATKTRKYSIALVIVSLLALYLGVSLRISY